MELSFPQSKPSLSMRPLLSPNTSNTSLNSLFSRIENSPFTTTSYTSTTTPATSPVYEVPRADEVSSLLNKRINSKTLVMLVGLPASGKSTVCKQLSNFLQSHDYKCQVYNAGNVRRSLRRTFSDADFFNPNNAAAQEQREQFAAIAMEQMLDDFRTNRINVGFLDATNTTRKRRDKMLDIVRHCDVSFSNVIILDISCTDERLLAFNVNGKTTNGDYTGRTVAEAIADFKQRSSHYYKVYEAISPEELERANDVVSTYISIQNAKNFRSYSIISEKQRDEVEDLFVTFAANYYKMHGERYYSAVDTFHKLTQQSV
ncbi:hypothetical protein CJJ07_004869 [Candidozyma auris]|nr:hypothetical protein CJJ07_004869 [[Candida] auris]QEL61896.1 hypothetical protein CJJ09_004056 [[Candida] auris]